MRHVRVVALAAAVCALSPAFDLSAADPPRLIVLLVVDQLRADYLTEFEQRWRSGFRTLLSEGAYFPRAEFPYWSTATCAGHSTIGTGTLPRTHGMILNVWWHREERRPWNCMDDRDAAPISYGRPVKLGASAKRLAVETLADRLRAERPGARVVSLSLKARSAIALAGHGGDVVTWWDDNASAFVTSRAFARAPVPELKAFIDRDPFEKDLEKTWTLQEPSHTYRFPDAGVGERPPSSWGALFPHRVGGEKVDDAFFTAWQTSPFADAYLWRMADAMIERLSLGQDETTDFLAIGFSSLDSVGHSFGPRSREIEDHLLRLDGLLGALITRLDAAVGRDRYVLALTSDHGVAPIPAALPHAGRVLVEEVREAIEEHLVDEWGSRQGSYVDAVSTNHVYFAPGVLDQLKRELGALHGVERVMTGIPGISRVFLPDELSDASADPVNRALALGYVPGRGGDMLFTHKEGWIVTLRTATQATSHGSAYAYDRDVPVVLFGTGIKSGRFQQSLTPADIAPTLAHVAGVTLPKAEGRVLTEALR
jgi:predicted AlkP superfamily pyrophosphatase or phosphodiesterase